MAKVLLVEDESSAAALVTELLPDDEVMAVPSLERALDATSGQDAIVLDLSLPDSVGFDTLTAFLTSVPHLPTIVLTSDDDPRMRVSALEAGAQDFLVKSDIRLLAQRLEAAILRHRHRTRALAEAFAAAERTSERMQGMLRPPARHSVEALGRKALSDALPEVFLRWTHEYAQLVRGYVQAASYRDRARPVVAAKKLVREIALVNAAPRDLVEVHLAAMEQIAAEATEEHARAIREDAPLILLEVMGYLAMHYRDQAIARHLGRR